MLTQVNKADLIKDWTAKLRSGAYSQGRFALKSDSGYCCLGVYVEGVLGCEFEEYGPQYFYKDDYNLLPSPEDAALIGLTNYIPEVDKDGIYKKAQELDVAIDIAGYDSQYQSLLASMNDNSASFDQIADMIEFLGLEKK